MKNQKLISLIVSVIYMFTLIPAVYAGDTLTVVSPENGSIVTYETNRFEVIPPNSKIITKTIFTLDGEFIGNGDEDGVLVRDEFLTLGAHVLKVIAIYDDSTAEMAISKFTAAIIPETFTIDFEDVSAQKFDSVSSAQSTIGWFKLINSGIYGNGGFVEIENSADHGNVFKVGIGSSGDTIYAGSAYFHTYARQLANKQFVSSTSNGKLSLDFDVCMRGFWGAQLRIYPYSNNGKNHSLLNLVNSNVIVGTNVSLSSGYNWYHVSLIYDLDNLIVYGKFGDTEIPPVNLIWNSNCSESEKNIGYYDIGCRLDGSGDYYLMDNFETGLFGNFTGVTDVLFKDGDEFIDSDDTPVNRDTSEMKIKFDKLLDPSTVIKENISVVMGGTNISVTDVIYNQSENSALLILNNPGITSNGKNVVSLSENIKLKGDSAVIGVASQKCFDVVPSGFEITEVEFSRGSDGIFTTSQLSTGESLSAKITVSNSTSNTEKLTAVLVLKDGKRFLSVTPLVMVVPAGNTNYYSSVTSPVITSAENLSAKVIFVNNMADSIYKDLAELK